MDLIKIVIIIIMLI